MPKINVYLPEDLAAAVRRVGIPVSPVCQAALADVVQRVTNVRKVIETIRNQTLSPDHMAMVGAAARVTDRVRTVVGLAGRAAAAAGTQITTGHLLLGLFEESGNVAVSLLQALDVDPDGVRSSIESSRPADAEAGEPRVADDGRPSEAWRNLSWPAWNAMAAAMEAAIGFGHDYVGCEHLLVGLLADPDSQAGQTLRASGVDEGELHRALTGAVAGFSHGRKTAGSIADRLSEIVDRLNGIEQRLAAIGA